MFTFHFHLHSSRCTEEQNYSIITKSWTEKVLKTTKSVQYGRCLCFSCFFCLFLICQAVFGVVGATVQDELCYNALPISGPLVNQSAFGRFSEDCMVAHLGWVKTTSTPPVRKKNVSADRHICKTTNYTLHFTRDLFNQSAFYSTLLAVWKTA